jgi:hypothetical protein
MRSFLVAGLIALGSLAVSPSTAQAQFQGPFSCGTFCVCHFGKMHFHGPLYNYGPYYGYPPFTNNCNTGNCGRNWNLGDRLQRDRGCNTCGEGWNRYALHTFKNVFHRTHPCGHKAGCLGCN